jgi:poly-gamma-glutamate capsule biosynthesis protein CapA/YwtB (metallophosphatase superfamily)
MGLRITLDDGREVLVRATLEEWQDAMRVATASGELLEIEQPGGLVIAFSPHEVRYAEEDADVEFRLAHHRHRAPLPAH